MSSPNDSTDPPISRDLEYPSQPAQPNLYSQPGAQPYPDQYAPPPMPPKRSNRTLWIVLGSVGGALLLLCVACSVLAITLGGQIGKQLGPTIGASGTLADFCAALQDQDYSRAYATFSTSLQRELTEDEFAANAAKLDTNLGRVTNCSTPSTESSSGDTVRLTVMMTRSGGVLKCDSDCYDHPVRIIFIKEGNDFKIDLIDPMAGLT